MLTVDHYINGQPAAYHNSLNRMRTFIQSKVPPQSEEKISYMVPCYYYHYSLVGFGVSKGHISFYTMSPKLVTDLKDELTHVKHAGSTLHFPLDKPFPEALLEKIINIRITENETRALAKKKKASELLSVLSKIATLRCATFAMTGREKRNGNTLIRNTHPE